ncbi:MAG: AMP-binding protein [Gammaproteobacteria bacterium]|nr:AMP-binding protein [Gammaproteobacteria bacterium]
MQKTVIDGLTKLQLFPMTLMLEYRTDQLDTRLTEIITRILEENLNKQTELVKDEPYRSIILNNQIETTDLEQWKNGTLSPPKRRIAVDQYIKACLAELSDNRDLTKIHELNQFVFLHRFEAYAKYYPDQPALVFNDQILTYAQLNARANQMAHFLLEQKKERGIDTEHEFIVGTFLPREPEWIIAILAIWKAGGAFIAIDPTAIGNSPDAIDDYFDKFAQTLADGKPTFILTHSDHQYLLPKPDKHGFFCLCLDDCEKAINFFPTENTDIKIDPEDLAYILYTSGSSGKPKGVEIAHRGFMPCIEAHRECVDLTCDSIMAQYATCDFDAWVAETLILGIGGTLAIVPSEIRLDEKRCAQYYRDHKINVVIFTPAFLNKLGGPENFPLWKALFIVGESFDWELVKKWKTDQLQIVNGYGLTETTICATLENLDMDEVGKPLSIGKAIVGTKILIKVPTNIDVNNPEIEKDYGTETTYQNPKSPLSVVDQAGEPWFGGISLTRRYRGDAMQNNAWRFEKIDDERYYKSGDRAILRADGRLEHQGRYSRMVKISGKRIELPSIEANLCEHFQLEKMHVAVTAVGNSLEDKNLTTLLVFLVEKEHQKLDDAVIRDFIINTEKNIDKQSPLHIIWKKDFPTTQTKINLVELNKSYFETHTQKTHDASSVDCKISSDENVILLKLQNCWKEVLCKTELSLEDDFFLIGGRSIDISPLIQVIRLAFPEIKEEINNALALECKTLLSQTKRLYSLLHPIELTDLKKKQNSDAPYIIFCPPSILGDPEQDYSEFFSQCDQDFKKSYFDERFQIYGLKARGLTDPSLMPTTLYSMAQDYALTIKYWIEKHNKKDIPIFILGWSSGGTLSPEIVNALAKYNITAYAYVCDSIAPFPFHHLSHEEQTLELLLLASKLSQAIGLKIDTQDLKTELSRLQKPRNRITHCFDYLIQKSKKNYLNILMTAKIIRLAEHNYIIREPLQPIRLYKAKHYLLEGILTEDKAHYWPKNCILGLDEIEDNIVEGNHFEMIQQRSLAQKITAQITQDFTYHKLKKLKKILENQANYVVPFIEIIETNVLEKEEETRLKILFSDAITNFLASPQKKVLLLQGESGLGKSIAAEHLEKSLEAIGTPTKKIMMNRYTSKELKRSIREDLKESGNVWDTKSFEVRVLILESYDEKQGATDFNYYDTNGLSDYENLKVIFTCQSETLKPGYLTNFIPREIEALDNIKLQAFNEEQIKDLMSIYLKKNTMEPNSHDLEKLYLEIKSHAELIELVKNPLLLKFVLKSLPILLKSPEKLTPFKIYEVFNQDYFERGEKKIKGQTGIEHDQDFQLTCRLHCQRIALAFFSEGFTSYEVKKSKSLLSASKKISSPLDNLFDSQYKQLLKASPLCSKNNIHQFIHRSVLEYFAAETLITTLREENVDYNELQTWFIESKLLPKKLVSNQGIVKFWAEGYRQYPTIKTTLDKIITETRNNEKIKTLGGIAITLLNMAGEFFNGTNLRDIRVPQAVLSGGYFDCADFTGSDLTDVNFFRAWLRNTRLNNCQLNGVSFGEYPYFKHNDAVWSMDFRPEINRLVTASKNIVYIWDVELVQCIEEFKTPMKCIDRVSMSDDGKKVALVGFDNTVRVLNLISREIIELNGHNAAVVSVYLSRDASKVASGSRDRTVRVWDLMNNQDTVLGKHDDTVTSVHLSADSSRLASGSDDKTIRVWNVAKAQLIAILRGHEREVTCVHLSGDGSTVASGSLDKTIRLWEIATGRSKVLKGHKFQITSIYLSDDGRKVVSGSDDFTVRIWEASTGASIVLSGHRDSVVSVRLSDDGLTLASAGFRDKTVRRWDLSTNQSVACHIRTDNNNRTFVLGSWDDTVSINDCTSNRPILLHSVQSKPLGNDKRDENFSVPFKVALCLMPRFQSIELGKPKSLILNEHISKNRQIIASASDRNAKTVEVLNLENGITKILEGHALPVTSCHLSEDGRIVVSGSQDFTVRMWEVESGNSLVLEGHRHVVSSVYLSKDGQTVVSGSWDKTVRIWDVSNSQSIILSGHEKEVSCVHISLNKTRVFSGSWDGTVRMWDAVSGLQLAVISSAEGVIAISLNERTNTLIVNYSTSIQVWDSFDDKPTDWRLRWSSNTNQSINLAGSEFIGSKDLSNQNQALIIQRGGFDTTTKPISHTQNPTAVLDDFDKLTQKHFESMISSAKIPDSQSSPKLIRKHSQIRDDHRVRFFSQGTAFDNKPTTDTQITDSSTNGNSSENESNGDLAGVTIDSFNEKSSSEDNIDVTALTLADQDASKESNEDATVTEFCKM